MSEHVSEQSTVRRLERSRSDRMLAGVCGGLAGYFQISPVFYRVGFVVLTLLGGAGVLIYAAAALVIPEEGKPDSIAAEILRSRRERPWPLIGLGLVAVAGAVLLSRATLWPRGDAAWVLILVAGAVILWTQRRSKQPELAASQTTGVAPARDRRRLGRPIAIAASALLVAVLVLAAVIATVFHVDVRNGIGERIYVPAAAADVHRHYRLGIGDLRLDLSGVEFPPGDTEVDLRVGIGRLVVTVPQDVALRVEASAQAGATRVLGRHDDGRNAGVKVTGTGRRLLVLNAKVGLGDVQVKRSVR
jgi:phage shock protein PspC (stress-responsive transcriptional regulator)/predicted membrane protein